MTNQSSHPRPALVGPQQIEERQSAPAGDGPGENPRVGGGVGRRADGADRYTVWVQAGCGGTGRHHLKVRTEKALEMDTPIEAVLVRGSVGGWALTGAVGQTLSVGADSDVLASEVEWRISE